MRCYRAYDTTTEWMGGVRESATVAKDDADNHNDGCKSQGGLGHAIVVKQDPDAPGRCINLDGEPVWPPHGRSTGTVRWKDRPGD